MVARQDLLVFLVNEHCIVFEPHSSMLRLLNKIGASQQNDEFSYCQALICSKVHLIVKISGLNQL